MWIFSSAAWHRRVRRRISLISFLAGSFPLIDPCLIFVLFDHCDESEPLHCERPYKSTDVRKSELVDLRNSLRYFHILCIILRCTQYLAGVPNQLREFPFLLLQDLKRERVNRPFNRIPGLDFRIAIVLFILAFLSYALIFNSTGGANAISRIALSLAIVERGELTIDSMHKFTIDKAFVDGHYVSDKAPGMSFTALPAVFLAVHLLRAPNFKSGSTSGKLANKKFRRSLAAIIYVATLSTSALFTAAAVAALFLAAWRLGANVQGALFAALAYGFGTPTWGWATTFFGHATSGAMLVLAFTGLVWFIPSSNQTFVRRKLLVAAYGVGIILGWAVVVELLAAPATIFIGLYALWYLRSCDRNIRLRITIAAMAGGLTALSPFLAYNMVLLGSPFELSYSHVVGFDGMQDGFFGIHLPNAQTLYEILLGERRGLIWLTPLMILFPFAWILLVRHAKIPLGLLVLGVGVAYIFTNAGYVYWDGGWSTGPRHITAALPFLCLPFAWLWTYGKYKTRIAAATLLAASIALSFVAASVDMTAPSDAGPNVVFDYLLPRFLSGDLHALLFTRLGLSGYYALLPLMICWIVAICLLRRWCIAPIQAKALGRSYNEPELAPNVGPA